jgi:hypothetical protein
VGISILIACFWAFWGSIENFHEGWHSPSLLSNLGLTLVSMLPMLFFVGLGLVSLRWPYVGSALHVLLALYLAFFFFSPRGGSGPQLIYGPLLLLGVLYAFGRPQPLRLAHVLLVGLPLLTYLLCGVEPAWRVASRVDDGNREARLVEGNGVRLIWAPAGPGWPDDGVDWAEANRRCRFLAADGKTLAATPQDIWRLPTVEEAVRSMARHGVNSGGVWEPATARASYRIRPDKESPLWDVHSPVIYWWTATELDDQTAYIVVYNGGVWPRKKELRPGYLAFRAVKRADASEGRAITSVRAGRSNGSQTGGVGLGGARRKR